MISPLGRRADAPCRFTVLVTDAVMRYKWGKLLGI